MKNIILCAFLFLASVTFAQVQTINSQLKLNTVNVGNGSENVLVRGTDNIVKYVTKASLLSGVPAPNLQSVTNAGNTTLNKISAKEFRVGTTMDSLFVANNRYLTFGDVGPNGTNTNYLSIFKPIPFGRSNFDFKMTEGNEYVSTVFGILGGANHTQEVSSSSFGIVSLAKTEITPESMYFSTTKTGPGVDNRTRVVIQDDYFSVLSGEASDNIGLIVTNSLDVSIGDPISATSSPQVIQVLNSTKEVNVLSNERVKIGAVTGAGIILIEDNSSVDIAANVLKVRNSDTDPSFNIYPAQITTSDRDVYLPDTDGVFIVRSFNPPARPTSAGVLGEIYVDASYIYICVDANSWVRASLGTW